METINVDEINTIEEFKAHIAAIDGLTEAEKTALIGLASRGKSVVTDRNEASVGICDDKNKGYGICLLLYSF